MQIAEKENMDNDKFIYDLINHIKEYGYWVDCIIYFTDKCWADFPVDSLFDKDASFIEKKENIYVHEVNRSCSDLVITLWGRMGGLLYSDMENPLLNKLSLRAKQYMQNHRSIYHIKNYDMADGQVALFALEEFLFDHGKIIVDWNVDENKDSIIVADISLDAIKRRDKGYVRFKSAIGYDY